MENTRQTAGSGAKPPGKKADLSSLLGTGATDVEFSFGGPASDFGGLLLIFHKWDQFLY